MEKMKQWSMLTALGVVGVMAAGWFLLVSPQHGHASDLRNQAAGVRGTTASLDSQVQQLKAQQKGVAAQQRTMAKIATQIPDNPALPALIRQLSAAAHDSGVTLVSLAPAQPAAVVAAAPATVTTSSAGTTTPAAVVAPLDQIPISVQVTGSYFNIESFFRAVEHLDRATIATGFTLGGNANGGVASANTTTGATAGDPANAAPGALSASIQAVVFMSPEAAAPVAPVTPTTTGTTATTGSAPTTQSTTANTAPAATPAQ